MNLDLIIKESIERYINENRVVTFGDATYPNFGWCVILAGGGGSGKGFSLNRNVPINGKVINVDDFKKLYVRLKKGMVTYRDDKTDELHTDEYDSLNPTHVNAVHQAVADMNYKGKYQDNLFNTDFHNAERIPNIIFDMTGKNPYKDVVGIARRAKSVGYKVALVWVVANRHEAIIRNLSRARRVPDNVLHKTHNMLATLMPQFLESPFSVQFLDDAWLVFSSTEGITRSDLQGDEAKQAVVHLQKEEDKFYIDDTTKERLTTYLGQNEENVDNPTTYMNSDDVAKQFGKRKWKYNDKKDRYDFNGFSFDRGQFNKDSNLYQK